MPLQIIENSFNTATDGTLISLPVKGEGNPQSQELHFICKPGLAGCRQSEAILDDLKRHVSQS